MVKVQYPRTTMQADFLDEGVLLSIDHLDYGMGFSHYLTHPQMRKLMEAYIGDLVQVDTITLGEDSDGPL